MAKNTGHALSGQVAAESEHDQVLTWHLSHVLGEYAEDFIGIQETRYLLEQMEHSYAEPR